MLHCADAFDLVNGVSVLNGYQVASIYEYALTLGKVKYWDTSRAILDGSCSKFILFPPRTHLDTLWRGYVKNAYS